MPTYAAWRAAHGGITLPAIELQLADGDAERTSGNTDSAWGDVLMDWGNNLFEEAGIDYGNEAWAACVGHANDAEDDFIDASAEYCTAQAHYYEAIQYYDLAIQAASNG